ncbi:MAG: hypothetical protein ACNA8W_00920 [Bradymonadaceae bacterium]
MYAATYSSPTPANLVAAVGAMELAVTDAAVELDGNTVVQPAQ